MLTHPPGVIVEGVLENTRKARMTIAEVKILKKILHSVWSLFELSSEN
jgi:hypothetical protein